jgi:hypothetical protein
VREDRKILILGAWRQFFHVDVKHDCRELLRIVGDMQANQAWAALGYAGLDELLRHGIEIDPELVQWAVEGLRTLDPIEPQPFDKAVEAGRLAAWGGDRGNQHTGGKRQSAAAPCQRGSDSNEYWRARLARDRPDILRELDAGEFKTAREAAIAVGLKKPPDAARQLIKWWGRAREDERDSFLIWLGDRLDEENA